MPFTEFSPRLNYPSGIWKCSSFSTVWPTVHTNPSRKQNFSKTAFKPEEFAEKLRLCVLVWMVNILNTQLFENNGIRIILWFPWACFAQTQNYRNSRLNGSHFENSTVFRFFWKLLISHVLFVSALVRLRALTIFMENPKRIFCQTGTVQSFRVR